jgi:hypothetical protein
MSPFVSPHSDLGIPLGSTGHLPLALTLRWEQGRHGALCLGLGAPASPVGASLWVGYEVFTTVASLRRGLFELDLYATPGLQAGFAGPEYFERHSNAFVGFAYIYSGPGAFATRLPLGARLRLYRRLLDVYGEATTTVALAPAVEVMVGVTAGVRVNF